MRADPQLLPNIPDANNRTPLMRLDALMLRLNVWDEKPEVTVSESEELLLDIHQCLPQVLDALRAVAVPSPAPTPMNEQTAWLVALGSMPPQWWTGRGDEFTAEIDGTQRNPAKCAMRFARREDAERAIGWLVKEGVREGCKAEEHLWL